MTRVTIDAGLLQMITNGLRRDVADGKVIRGEWLAEIEKDAELEQNTFPLNPNAASKWAHLQKHDGAEAIGVVFRTGSGSVGSLVDGRVVWADWLAHPNGSKPESVNAELLEALKECVDLSWIDDSHVVDFDKSVMFGPHYDFSGVDGPCRAEFIGEHECIVWPRGGKWSAYCTYDGSLWFEKFTTSHEAKERCMRLLDKVIPDHPAMKARAAIARAESAIETPAKVSPASTPPLPHHVFRELVNDLRDLAKQFHGHESLRDRISGRLAQDVPVVGPCQGHAVQQEAAESCAHRFVRDEEAPRHLCCQACGEVKNEADEAGGT